ncbi:MAG TPA: hypothetical protein VF796_01105 [Humisphaera sp.]
MPCVRVRTGSSSASVRRGLTLTDVCVILAVVAVLCLGVLPQVRQWAAEQADRAKCAANLRQLALGATQYAEANRVFPRLYYSPGAPPAVYTGVHSPKAFDGPTAAPGGQRVNEVAGALFHLYKSMELDPASLACPADDAKPLAKDALAKFNNFPEGRANLSYSYNNPYATQRAMMEGWSFRPTTGAEAPLAADMNPGDSADGGPTKVAFDAPAAAMAKANSANHKGAGQNVAYCDGHVEWAPTPFAGKARRDRPWKDNIYATVEKVDEKTGRGGLTHGAPADAFDAALLPTRGDAPPKAGDK